MMNYMYGGGYGFGGGFPMFGLGPLFLLVIAWSLFWKGLALWHAAQRKEKGWFIALMVLNTMGILDIFYLVSVAKVKMDKLW